MAEATVRVELTASFLERLAAIEALVTEADTVFAYDRLLEELRTIVIPNLQRFPSIGRRYLDRPPQSAESLSQLAALPAATADRLREYLHGNYLILYTLATPGNRVYLLSIRHHRELSFQFSTLWPGPEGNPEGA